MSSGKNISKSVRLRTEITDYIENYRGENFSSKLENLVLDAVMGETQRKERFALWEERIRCKEREYDALCTRYCSSLALFRDFAALEPHVRRLLDAADRIQNVEQDNP